MTDINLSQTERHVLNQIHDGNHTLDTLKDRTGFTRPKLSQIVIWLSHDDLVTAAWNSEIDGIWIELTDAGREHCGDRDRHPLNYV